MEFLDKGKHCQLQSCNQFDYLPFECFHCKGSFCKVHRAPKDHECQAWVKLMAPAPIVKKKKKKTRCKVCRRVIPNRNIAPCDCDKCGMIVCETHRLPEYHDCKWLETLRHTKKGGKSTGQKRRKQRQNTADPIPSALAKTCREETRRSSKKKSCCQTIFGLVGGKN